jgi:6-carboxyhexanoate--CoA ligase
VIDLVWGGAQKALRPRHTDTSRTTFRDPTMSLYSVKMRASQTVAHAEKHISGAERIVAQEHLESVCASLVRRALHHAKGDPDQINVKIERVDEAEILYLDALPVRTLTVETPEEGRALASGLLAAEGLENADAIVAKIKDAYLMRGAVLLDIHTLARLEPNPERGLRTTYMDYADSVMDASTKNHFKEALVLATKTAACPGIVGEFCVSDDPDYVTGYVASRKMGYVRITKLKQPGDENGGRIFLFDSTQATVASCLEFIQKRKVLVRLCS